MNAMPPASAFSVERALRERIAELEEALRQAQERAVPSLVFPREWGLTPAQSRGLAALYRAPGGFLAHDVLFEVIRQWSEGENQRSILRSQMSRLKHLVASFGIEVQLRWGFGYEITPASKAVIKAALQQRAAA